MIYLDHYKKITKLEPYEVVKKWGSETIIINSDHYCLKFLNFNEGAQFSYHFHDQKQETWYIEYGEVELKTCDLKNGEETTTLFRKGSIIHVPRLCPHQILAKKETKIIEVSTPHYDTDSFRIKPGDSQK
jgi:mannose-6-phosphate isomerase-like protein (cupin superfamily)